MGYASRLNQKSAYVTTEMDGDTCLITVHSASDWDLYKRDADWIYFNQKGSTPKMDRLHNIIEQLAWLYQPTDGKKRCAVADGIRNIMNSYLQSLYGYGKALDIPFTETMKINGTLDIAHNLWLEACTIIEKNKSQATHYFD